MESVTNGLLHELSSDGRVNTTANRTDHLALVANQGLDPLNLLVHKFLHAPFLFRTADMHSKVLQNLGSARGMSHLGVELNAKVGLGGACNSGKGCVSGGSDDLEVRGQLGQLVAVRHPHFNLIRQSLEQTVNGPFFARVTVDVQMGMSVFLLLTGQNALAVVPGEFLQTVADTQDRDIQLEHLWVDVRGDLFVDGEWASGQDHTGGLPGQFGDLLGAWQHFGVDIEFTQTSRNQMGVLRAVQWLLAYSRGHLSLVSLDSPKVQDQDRIKGLVRLNGRLNVGSHDIAIRSE